jgi:site-specific recombinase XerD
VTAPARRDARSVRSCVDCLAWGVVGAKRCSACTMLRHDHPGGDGQCAGCGRVLALKRGFCRLCWQQAAYESKAAGGLPRGAVTVLESGQPLRHHQLFFDRMKLRRNASPDHKYGRRRGRPPKTPPTPTGPPRGQPVQLGLFEVRRDFTRFDESTGVDPTNPWLEWAIYLAHRRGEARGWSRYVRDAVRRGLTIVLSGHAAGDPVYWSELLPAMRAVDVGTERVAEILDEMGVLRDDRRPAFEDWLDRKLDGLTTGVRDPVESWLRTMRDGGPRSTPRDPATVWNYMNSIRTILLDWSARYDHLREVTRDDILAVADSLLGAERHHTISVLRSLFRHCNKTRAIFRDPAARIRVGEHPRKIMLPLESCEIEQSVAAATTPAAKAVLALAAVHAARSKAIRELRLEDVDLGNRRLTIAGRARPLDDLTRQMLVQWLDHRRTRWPNTANPHLIVNQQTAMGTAPVSSVHLTDAFRGQAATLERLRVHRQLDEALTLGPDPLHLAAVFGLDPKTAIRYAENARTLLVTAAEEHNPPAATE